MTPRYLLPGWPLDAKCTSTCACVHLFSMFLQDQSLVLGVLSIILLLFLSRSWENHSDTATWAERWAQGSAVDSLESSGFGSSETSQQCQPLTPTTIMWLPNHCYGYTCLLSLLLRTTYLYPYFSCYKTVVVIVQDYPSNSEVFQVLAPPDL